MWGEGASDLWGRLEQEEDEREQELLEAVRERLRRAGSSELEDEPAQASVPSLGTAA
jgi:hypothetical protein